MASGQDEYELMKCDSPEQISQANVDELAHLVKKEMQGAYFVPAGVEKVPSDKDN